MQAQALPNISSSEETGSSLKLGTFIGVFTPTVLTILGVIMYLRMGWVVGHAGLSGTLGIVILANLITLLTSLSLSALATNMKVGVGGAYYLISRSFGLASVVPLGSHFTSRRLRRSTPTEWPRAFGLFCRKIFLRPIGSCHWSQPELLSWSPPLREKVPS